MIHSVNSFIYHCYVLVAKSCPTLLRSHRLQFDRFLCPQNIPGKNTGVCCHFSLQGINPGVKPTSSSLAGRFFTNEPPGKPFIYHSAMLTTTAIMLCIISLILLYLITGSVYFFGHFLLPPYLLTLIQSCPLHVYNKMFTEAPCFVPMFYLEKIGA